MIDLSHEEIEFLLLCLNCLKLQWGAFRPEHMDELIEKLEAIAPPCQE